MPDLIRHPAFPFSAGLEKVIRIKSGTTVQAESGALEMAKKKGGSPKRPAP
jgi:hypothetical protein